MNIKSILRFPYDSITTVNIGKMFLFCLKIIIQIILTFI
jgi:hypothetical protein